MEQVKWGSSTLPDGKLRTIKGTKENKLRKDDGFRFPRNLHIVRLSWRPPHCPFCKLDLVLYTNVTGVLKERSGCFWQARLKRRCFSGIKNIWLDRAASGSKRTSSERNASLIPWTWSWIMTSRNRDRTATQLRRSKWNQNSRTYPHEFNKFSISRHTDWTVCWPLKPRLWRHQGLEGGPETTTIDHHWDAETPSVWVSGTTLQIPDGFIVSNTHTSRV